MANDINKEDPHYKGEYGSIYEVNRKFPTGGVAGDFVVIDGWAHYWNADRGTWCVNAERDSYWDELITNIIEKFKLVRGATYMGVASLATVPTKDIGAKMYYFATVAGTYKNFGGLVVPQGINVLYSENGSSWVNTTLLEVAQELGVSTNKVVSQKAVSDKLSDLSKNHTFLPAFTDDIELNKYIKEIYINHNGIKNKVGTSIIFSVYRSYPYKEKYINGIVVADNYECWNLYDTKEEAEKNLTGIFGSEHLCYCDLRALGEGNKVKKNAILTEAILSTANAPAIANFLLKRDTSTTLLAKIDKSSIVQQLGESEDKVVSQAFINSQYKDYAFRPAFTDNVQLNKYIKEIYDINNVLKNITSEQNIYVNLYRSFPFENGFLNGVVVNSLMIAYSKYDTTEEAEKNIVGIFGSNEARYGYAFCDLRSMNKGTKITNVKCKLPISQNNLAYCPSIASYLASNKNAKQDAEIAKKANISDLTSYSDKQELSETRFGFYFQKILCLGDSIVEGDYGSYPEGTKNVHKWSFPYYLAKFTNAEVVNNGKSGWTTKQVWDNKDTLVDLSTEYDCIYIRVGANGGLTDTIETDAAGSDYNSYNTDSNTGCYCALVAWLKEKLPKTRIFLINFHYYRKGEEWSKNMSAIIAKIAEKFNLHVIDVMNHSPFEATLENARIYRPVGIDEEIQATGSSMGNAHFGRLGYLTFARCVYQETQRIISENKEEFALGY